MSGIQGIHRVISNRKLCPKFYCLAFEAPSVARKVKPGQFVHLRTAEGFEPFFRRPFSVYRSLKHVEIFYEAVGPGTRLLAEKKKGDAIDVVGPVGTPFTLPPRNIKQVVMVAGGIGIAPFLALTDVLKKRTLELILLYGGRTKDHVYPMKEFKANGCKVFVTTDDGSAGVKGRVSHLFSKIDCHPQTTMMYTCGPRAMMKAVQDFAREKKLKGEAACEEVMACALGACLGCSIKTTSGYKTVCYEGPVFDLQEVVF